MAAPPTTQPSVVTAITPITIKISLQGTYKKLKLPLSDLVPAVLPGKLREFLAIPAAQAVVFERFSDSSSSYVNLDPSNVHAYKTLYRAAKAKLKLRMRASLAPSPASTFPPAAIMASPLGDIFKPPFVSTLTLGSDLTLHNMPGPSTSAVPPPPHPQSSSVEVDAKPESNILPQSTPESTIAAATLEFKEKMEDLHKVVADIFNSVKDESTSPNIPQLKSTLDEKPNTQRDSVQSASVPRTFVHRLSGHSQQANAWSVYCDNCEKNMLNEHYHCNICNAGDYDICPECRDSGVHCKGEGHWLIKRVFNPDGTIVTSTTEKVGPKSAPEGAKEVKDMPGAFTEEKKDVLQPTRTCNCCVKVFPEFAFVTCNNCEDYDLCVPCLEEGKHGHHPAHKFEPATHVTNLSERTKKLCMPGRNAVHSATCDNCDCTILGVRYKCQVCPDWDYCQNCIGVAPAKHGGHRFAPIYDPIPLYPVSNFSTPTHYGIYCDGPLCTNTRSYIRGIRYKCAVCPDVDFCANCEASPTLSHNNTHPFLKFRSSVRHCSITTEVRNKTVSYHGDGNKSAFDAAIAAAAVANASTSPVQTIVDVKPAEVAPAPKERIQIKDLLSEPIPDMVGNKAVDQQKIAIKDLLSGDRLSDPVNPDDLQAHFIRDIIADGTTFEAGQKFIQGWTLKNPGPYEWPAGCSVKYVGGDNMLDVDDSRPSSEADVSKASETNVTQRSIKVGEELKFYVQMKAPKREGCAISYWRIKAPDGTPFGHRLWCHINAVAATTVKREVQQPQGCPHLAFLNNTANKERISSNLQSRKLEREQIMRQIRAYRRQEIAQGSPSSMFDKNMSEASFTERVRRLDGMLEHRLRTLQLSSEKFPESPKKEEQAEAAAEGETKSMDSSNLIFPASVSQEALPKLVPTNAAESVTVPAVAEPATVVEPEVKVEEPQVKHEDDIFEDAESITLDSSDEDGFLTDEEYDILNASDEEDSKA